VGCERTFIMLKPDIVARGRMGEVISRFERKGFKVAAARMLWIKEELASRHYAEHVEKPFYPPLRDFITSGPVLAMVIEGEEAVAQVREMMGATDPKKSPVGSIRKDFAVMMSRNVIHGSDSLESAKREIALFFDEDQIFSYPRGDDPWLTGE